MLILQLTDYTGLPLPSCASRGDISRERERERERERKERGAAEDMKNL